MELRKNWRKLTTALSRFWHREAGPMNWKNPVRVVAYIGWEIFNGVRLLFWWVNGSGTASGPYARIFLGWQLPPTFWDGHLFSPLSTGGVWFAVWSFVLRRPFPALETRCRLLDSFEGEVLEYHNPKRF